MKLKRFDVVELNNGNKATIFDIKNNELYGEIVNEKGITIEHRNINENEIKKVLISKDKIRYFYPGVNHYKSNGLLQEIFLSKFPETQDKFEFL